jgi:hypothetical protein
VVVVGLDVVGVVVVVVVGGPLVVVLGIVVGWLVVEAGVVVAGGVVVEAVSGWDWPQAATSTTQVTTIMKRRIATPWNVSHHCLAGDERAIEAEGAARLATHQSLSAELDALLHAVPDSLIRQCLNQ